jgi:hypothetical protein
LRRSILLADHALTLGDEILHDVEYLGLDGDELRATPQLPSLDVQ